MGVGRKSKYETNILPNLDYIQEQLSKGVPEKTIAKALNVGYGTWNRFKIEKRKELCDILAKDLYMDLKDHAMNEDDKKLVELLKMSLIEKSCGHTKKITKHMKVKCIEYDPDTGKKWREAEKVVAYEEEQYFPPETNAILAALNIYDKKYVKDYAAHLIKLREITLKEKQADKEEW